jgi:hypothetical protein
MLFEKVISGWAWRMPLLIVVFHHPCKVLQYKIKEMLSRGFSEQDIEN